MNPLTINPVPLLAGGALALALGFGGGWAINGWRLAADMATVQKDAAESRATSANKALDQLAGRLNDMSTATTAAQLDVSTLAVKMDLIRKEQKNAQAQTPLPVDCKPDAGRVSRLRDAVAAANAAITGSTP